MRKWNKKNKKQIHNYTHEIYVENTCTSCKMRSPMSQTLRSAYYYSPVIIILFPDKKTIILSGVYCSCKPKVHDLKHNHFDML